MIGRAKIFRFECDHCGCDREWLGDKISMWAWCFLCDEPTYIKNNKLIKQKKLGGAYLSKIKKGLLNLKWLK